VHTVVGSSSERILHLCRVPIGPGVLLLLLTGEGVISALVTLISEIILVLNQEAVLEGEEIGLRAVS
jgi:hypothetical protein